MITLEEFSAAALARHDAKQADKGRDDISNQIAGFHFNTTTRRFEVEVCGCIVADFADLDSTLQFCAMHHDGFLR